MSGPNVAKEPTFSHVPQFFETSDFKGNTGEDNALKSLAILAFWSLLMQY